MTQPRGVRSLAELRPDPARVAARLFLPGEELHVAHSRARQIIERVMSLDEDEVGRLVAELFATFAPRHRDYEQVLVRYASVVGSHIEEFVRLSHERTLILGASFTSEYAVEGAALCNPSAVLHPDQRDLSEGQIRIAVSLRGIGEGHVSSIGFCSAVIGPGRQWSFTPRPARVSSGRTSPAPWRRARLGAVLGDLGEPDELALSVVGSLPDRFAMSDFDRAVAQMHPDLTSRSGASGSLHAMRDVLSSAYVVEFDPDVPLEERVIMPWASEESNGMEDARFTRFVEDDGTVEYRATYTAYDGHNIVPRLLTSPDLCTFEAHRLAGSASRNKGMALFPRKVQGRLLALCRSDGENTSIASSMDGYAWTSEHVIHEPTQPWESIQVGNCGPPIETDAGWLVLTHGVGAMRTYSIGAMLLDLNDPGSVIGRLNQPLLEPTADEQDGYVPNVVYSCGGILHDGVLWLPYGVGDARIGVAHVAIDELLSALKPA